MGHGEATGEFGSWAMREMNTSPYLVFCDCVPGKDGGRRIKAEQQRLTKRGSALFWIDFMVAERVWRDGECDRRIILMMEIEESDPKKVASDIEALSQNYYAVKIDEVMGNQFFVPTSKTQRYIVVMKDEYVDLQEYEEAGIKIIKGQKHQVMPILQTIVQEYA